jgi:hypothetical protein
VPIPATALEAAREGVGECVAEVRVECADAEGNGDAADVERQGKRLNRLERLLVPKMAGYGSVPLIGRGS